MFLSPPTLRKNPAREIDGSDWAVNLCDTAAFSAANDSLQKTDQSWSTCHVSQSHAAAPPTYTSSSEDAADQKMLLWRERCSDLVGGVGWVEGGAWLQLKTLMLIDHTQKHGQLEMRGQAHTPRNAADLKIWFRAISCQSRRFSQLTDFCLFFSLRGCTHRRRMRDSTRTLIFLLSL